MGDEHRAQLDGVESDRHVGAPVPPPVDEDRTAFGANLAVEAVEAGAAELVAFVVAEQLVPAPRVRCHEAVSEAQAAVGVRAAVHEVAGLGDLETVGHGAGSRVAVEGGELVGEGQPVAADVTEDGDPASPGVHDRSR